MLAMAYALGSHSRYLNILRSTIQLPTLGQTPEEWVAIFDEAPSFFGLWARQGSRLNADRHPPNAKAASVGAERFVSKIRVAEAKLVGRFLGGAAITIADCVTMALVEFVDQFYGVSLPADC